MYSYIRRVGERFLFRCSLRSCEFSLHHDLKDQTFSRKNNEQLEKRCDVLRFTSEPMPMELEFIGRVSAVVYFSSTSPSPDLFVRLCVVSGLPKTSVNLCDGYLRVGPTTPVQVMPDGTRRVQVDMWATAYRLKPGHRLRVTVCSGAHPRFLRSNNTLDASTGVHWGTPTASQWIYHDREHPSCVVLPVMQGF